MACHALIHETSENRYCCLPVCPGSAPDIGQTYLQQQLTEHKQKYFASPSKNAVEKIMRKKQKERELQSFLRYTKKQ